MFIRAKDLPTLERLSSTVLGVFLGINLADSKHLGWDHAVMIVIVAIWVLVTTAEMVAWWRNRSERATAD
jgi:predicted Na+-dependent transporter